MKSGTPRKIFVEKSTKVENKFKEKNVHSKIKFHLTKDNLSCFISSKRPKKNTSKAISPNPNKKNQPFSSTK